MISRRHFGHLLAAACAAPALPSWALPDASARPRFSVMLWTLAKLAPFDRALGIVADAGFDGVELVGEFHPWDAAQRTAFRQRLGGLKLEVDAMSGVSAGFAVPDQAARFLTEFQTQVDNAQSLGCRRVILLSGNTVPGLSPSAQMQCSVDGLKRASDIAAKSGIDLVIEPIDPLENPSIFLQSVQMGAAIATAVDRPNVNVLYDIYHQQRGFGNLIETFEQHKDRIKLVHIADVPGRHEPGTGEIDYGQIYAAMARLGYAGWIAMEFYPTGDPVSTLRHAREDALKAFA